MEWTFKWKHFELRENCRLKGIIKLIKRYFPSSYYRKWKMIGGCKWKDHLNIPWKRQKSGGRIFGFVNRIAKRGMKSSFRGQWFFEHSASWFLCREW